jgi:hypothetical protein
MKKRKLKVSDGLALCATNLAKIQIQEIVQARGSPGFHQD